MTDYLITVAFEIARPKTRALSEFSKSEPRSSGNSNTVTRLLGRRLESSPAFEDEYRHPSPGAFHEHLVSVKVLRIRGSNSIAVLTFDLPVESIETANDLRRVNSMRIKSICSRVGFELIFGHYIYGVTASISSAQLNFDSHVEDTWMHFAASRDNLFFDLQIAEELASRIAIERALLAKALDDPQNSLRRWARIPFAALAVRKWQVELLIDKQSTQSAYSSLRDAMNLPKLRAETLDRARTWHVALGTVLAFTAAATTLLTLLMR